MQKTGSDEPVFAYQEMRKGWAYFRKKLSLGSWPQSPSASGQLSQDGSPDFYVSAADGIIIQTTHVTCRLPVATLWKVKNEIKSEIHFNGVIY